MRGSGVLERGRVRKGKTAMTNSARKKIEVENPYVSKTRRRRDLRIGGGDGSGSHSQMDYSTQVVDPTPAHDEAVYEEGFVEYDRMKEDRIFYQPQGEAKDGDVTGDEEVPEDVVADYMEAENVIPEGEPEPQTQRRRRRVPPIPPYHVGEPPYPGGPETTSLLSDYARHVANPLWINHHNMWHDQTGYKCINAEKKMKELGKPEAVLRWFWEPVEGQHDLIYTTYSTVVTPTFV